MAAQGAAQGSKKCHAFIGNASDIGFPADTGSHCNEDQRRRHTEDGNQRILRKNSFQKRHGQASSFS